MSRKGGKGVLWTPVSPLFMGAVRENSDALSGLISVMSKHAPVKSDPRSGHVS
jgi:hypothetical protein